MRASFFLARAVFTITITFEHVATFSDISAIDVDSLSEISVWDFAACLIQWHITQYGVWEHRSDLHENCHTCDDR
jgi:hypothetical protein